MPVLICCLLDRQPGPAVINPAVQRSAYCATQAGRSQAGCQKSSFVAKTYSRNSRPKRPAKFHLVCLRMWLTRTRRSFKLRTLVIGETATAEACLQSQSLARSKVTHVPCSWSETSADIIERMLGMMRITNIVSDDAVAYKVIFCNAI